MPTISSPAADTFYITPAVSGNNVFNVYIYKNNAWALFKSASVDLSELSGEISELKGDLSEEYELIAKEFYLNNQGKMPLPAVFVHGTISNNVPATAPIYNYRVCTLEPITFDYPVTLKAKTGYKFRVTILNVGQYDNQTEYTIPANEEFYLTIMNTANETAKAKADLPSYVSAVTMDIKKYLEINEAISNNDDTFDKIIGKLILRKPENLLNESALTVGYVAKNGSIGDASTYRYTENINVSEGDVYSFWTLYSATPTPVNARFTCAYDINNEVVSESGSDINISSYTVPSGIDHIKFTFTESTLVLGRIMIVKGSLAPYQYSSYFEPYYMATADFIQGAGGSDLIVYTKRQDNLSTAITFPATNIVKNIVYAFTANVNSMGTIIIGQGESSTQFMSCLEVTSEKATIIVNNSRYEQNHNLTIEGYISVKIVINDNTKATVTIESNGETYTRTIGWYGFTRQDYYCKQSGASLSNVSFSVSFEDIKCDTWVFGDSYTAILESDSKWTHYLVSDGFGNNVLLNALPGENGADSFTALLNILKMGIPKTIVWCLGMNDGTDAGETPNADWMTCINNVLSVCDNYGIKPILATIPTVPTINHEAKNAWIRESGCRYIDFAQAVGATSTGTWYPNMLSQDGVHPTALGAKRLYTQALCDAPELTERK